MPDRPAEFFGSSRQPRRGRSTTCAGPSESEKRPGSDDPVSVRRRDNPLRRRRAGAGPGDGPRGAAGAGGPDETLLEATPPDAPSTSGWRSLRNNAVPKVRRWRWTRWCRGIGRRTVRRGWGSFGGSTHRRDRADRYFLGWRKPKRRSSAGETEPNSRRASRFTDPHRDIGERNRLRNRVLGRTISVR